MAVIFRRENHEPCGERPNKCKLTITINIEQDQGSLVILPTRGVASTNSQLNRSVSHGIKNSLMQVTLCELADYYAIMLEQ